MMYEGVALLAGFAALYSMVGGRIERTWISGPIVFTAFGLLIGPIGLDLLSFEGQRDTLGKLAELTLALVLFTDAAGADMNVLRRTARLPSRLLVVGLPLTIVFGYAVGVLLDLDLSPLGIALLATMLAPTDAALGQAVVSNPAVPDSVRQGLNVESGLNDGICVPVLLVFLALAVESDAGNRPLPLAAFLLLEELGIGAAVGLALAALSAGCLRLAEARGWVSSAWSQVPIVALAFTCFALAQALGGSGFIAAFVGGLLFGVLAGHSREKYLLAAEGAGHAFALITWVVFGALVIGQAIGHFSLQILLYSLLSLTVIRMLPVFVALSGLGLSTETKLFVGWFGPRGLATIVFAIMVIDAGVADAGKLAMLAASTVILSIVMHGVTANRWAAGYGRRSLDR